MITITTYFKDKIWVVVILPMKTSLDVVKYGLGYSKVLLIKAVCIKTKFSLWTEKSIPLLLVFSALPSFCKLV